MNLPDPVYYNEHTIFVLEHVLAWDDGFSQEWTLGIEGPLSVTIHPVPEWQNGTESYMQRVQTERPYFTVTANSYDDALAEAKKLIDNGTSE